VELAEPGVIGITPFNASRAGILSGKGGMCGRMETDLFFYHRGTKDTKVSQRKFDLKIGRLKDWKITSSLAKNQLRRSEMLVAPGFNPG